MRVVVLIVAITVLSSSVSAQSYIFTIAGGASGSGSISLGAQLPDKLFPVTAMAGFIDGNSIALLTPATFKGTGYFSIFNVVSLDGPAIVATYPLQFFNKSGYGYIQAQGAGDFLYDPADSKLLPISFTLARPVMNLTSHLLAPQPTPHIRRGNDLAISISIPAAIAVATLVYEHYHHREHRSAVPAGRY